MSAAPSSYVVPLPGPSLWMASVAGLPEIPCKKTFLYFEWSPPWHLFVIVSDISSGHIYGIIFWHSILAFYLASILTSYLAVFVASILTFSLAFYLFFFAICSGIRSGMLSGIRILSGISSEILCCWGPARNGGRRKEGEKKEGRRRRVGWHKT